MASIKEKTFKLNSNENVSIKTSETAPTIFVEHITLNAFIKIE